MRSLVKIFHCIYMFLMGVWGPPWVRLAVPQFTPSFILYWTGASEQSNSEILDVANRIANVWRNLKLVITARIRLSVVKLCPTAFFKAEVQQAVCVSVVYELLSDFPCRDVKLWTVGRWNAPSCPNFATFGYQVFSLTHLKALKDKDWDVLKT